MKIRLNQKTGYYYAHLTGSKPINLRTKNQTEAQALAKASRLEEIEFAAKSKLLTAEAVQRLSCGGSKVSGEKALTYWQSQCEENGLSPATLDSYRSHINRFVTTSKLIDLPISNVTTRMVDSFINADDSVGVSTRRMRKASLDSFFDVCSNKGLVVGNPVAGVKIKMHKLSFEQKEPKVRVPFTESEIVLLNDVTSTFWKVAIAMSLHYGLRLSDVAQLEWASVQGDLLIVWTDKRDRRIAVPWVDEVKVRLSEVPRSDPRWVFPEQAAIIKDMKTRAKLSVQFSRILDQLGIEGKSFHCLRHTFATRRAALGESVDEIRQKMGHESTETTKQYIHQ